MIAVLLKAILFYFLFVFIRNVIFGYKAYQQVKDNMGHGPSQGPSSSNKYRGSQDDVLEAEYRVIKD
jgi:hypothetical protein